MAKAKTAQAAGFTEYSEHVDGDQGNFNQSVRFDTTDRYVGVTQFDGDRAQDRILLTPKQFKALKKFVEDHQ